MTEKEVKVYCNFFSSCEEECGIVPGFAQIPLSKWKKFQNFAKKFSGFAENRFEVDNSSGGHGCGQEYKLIKIWHTSICRVRSFPEKVYMTRFFDIFEEFMLEVEQYQEEGCPVRERFSSEKCGDWISETLYNRCEKHLNTRGHF